MRRQTRAQQDLTAIATLHELMLNTRNAFEF
jgi:hypothetical protein